MIFPSVRTLALRQSAGFLYGLSLSHRAKCPCVTFGQGKAAVDNTTQQSSKNNIFPV